MQVSGMRVVHTGERIPLFRPPNHIGIFFIVKNPAHDIDSDVQKWGEVTRTTHWNSFWRNAGTTFLASLLNLGGEPPVGLESATWLSVAIPVGLLMREA